MTVADLWVYIRDGGIIAVLFLIILGGWKRYWVFGWYAEEQARRITTLENRLERATRVAETGTDAADRATRVAERRALGAPDAP
jgi:hypothetical protein